MNLFSRITEDNEISRSFKKFIHPSWHLHLIDVLTSKAFKDSMIQLQNKEMKNNLCLPSPRYMLRAFEWDFNKINTVVLGQCPYPSIYYTNDKSKYYEMADGLAFSTGGTPNSTPIMTQSLWKIKEALEEDNLLSSSSFNPTLDRWADQGILLLNVSFTTRMDQPNSHNHLWKKFTQEVMSNLDEHTNAYFILMGDQAHKFLSRIKRAKAHNRYICIEHPVLAAREEREWFHEGCFKMATKFAEKRNKILNW